MWILIAAVAAVVVAVAVVLVVLMARRRPRVADDIQRWRQGLDVLGRTAERDAPDGTASRSPADAGEPDAGFRLLTPEERDETPDSGTD